MMNTFQLPSEQIKQNKNKYNYNKIKTRAKYVQNLLSDMSIKKYKQSTRSKKYFLQSIYI